MKKSYLREDYWIFFLHLDDNWSSAIDNLARQNSPDEENSYLIKEVVLEFKYMYPGEGGISSIITGLDSIWSATPLATILLQYT